MTIKNNYTLLTYRNFADLICASIACFRRLSVCSKSSTFAATQSSSRAATVRIVELNCGLCSSATVKPVNNRLISQETYLGTPPRARVHGGLRSIFRASVNPAKHVPARIGRLQAVADLPLSK
jgi:hypothetical protein